MISKIIFNLGSYNFLAYLECVRSYAWSKGHSDPDLSSVQSDLINAAKSQYVHISLVVASLNRWSKIWKFKCIWKVFQYSIDTIKLLFLFCYVCISLAFTFCNTFLNNVSWNPFNGGTIKLISRTDNILVNFFGDLTKIAILSEMLLSLLGTITGCIVYLEISWFSVLLEFAPYLETLWRSWVNLALLSDVTIAVNFHSWHLYFAK